MSKSFFWYIAENFSRQIRDKFSLNLARGEKIN